MATFDQLSAEQRAIIELVLKQGQSYDQLSDMLGLPVARVRELAREALVKLSPVSAAAVEGDWRGQLADYLLNQQAGPESTATRGHLRRSESARGWARSVLDSLEQFYDERNLPTIPAGEPEAAPRPRREPRRRKEPRERRRLSPAAEAAVRRRRLTGAGALALAALLVLFVWPVGVGPLAIGGDDGGGNGGETQADTPGGSADGEQRIIGQLPLRAVEGTEGAEGEEAQGIAALAQNGEQRVLIVQAALPPNDDGEAYQVWLYNSQDDAVSLGAQVADQQGVFQGAGPLPDDFERYGFIDVSREQIPENEEQVEDQAGHSGESVLRGRLDQLAPPPQGVGEQPGGGQGDAP